MENSHIEWTDHTANLWHGCMEVHEGCDNCYAKQMNNRYHHEKPHWGGKVPRLIIKKTFYDLMKFQKKAANAGEIHKVFVGSMMDIFEKPMPLVDGNGNSIELDDPESEMYTNDLRDALFGNISRGEYPNLLFLLLTKRPSNINKYIPESWKVNGAPTNVIFGTSVVNQETADKMIPELLQVNGRRFLSCEPLLGSIDINLSIERWDVNNRLHSRCNIHWVIAGGESGPLARPMSPDWARSLRDQCAEVKVPFFFKQWGEYVAKDHASDATLELIDQGMKMGLPDFFYRVGKKLAGSLLDGIEHKEFPL